MLYKHNLKYALVSACVSTATVSAVHKLFNF
jgi:hypothetical protein